MKLNIKKNNNIEKKGNLVILGTKETDLSKFNLSDNELAFVKKQIEADEQLIEVNQYENFIFINLLKLDKTFYLVKEAARKAANKMFASVNSKKLESITIVDTLNQPQYITAYLEGLSLSNYQFIKYLKDTTDKKTTLTTVELISENISETDIEQLQILTDAVCIARDWVNEPYSYINAIQLSEEFKKLGTEAGFSVEVFDKKKIESLRMGGLLAVNQGSVDPPTFSILEWKPENAVNQKPIILVGKGVVFDTGGLSLKATKDSMDSMKCDMAGAAAVGASIYALAKTKTPVHIIGLVPATDNRPSGNAITPGDVIKMYNGLTVEVLNTDAEGRLILADALSYAQKYDPELVIDLATLTGAAAGIFGPLASIAMGNASDKIFAQLVESGYETYERTVQFPFWEEFDKLIKSDIADIKNIGSGFGGASSAGKFLERFVNYPWIHIDIAGPAFINSSESYHSKGGTGYGVRLLFDFVRKNFKV